MTITKWKKRIKECKANRKGANYSTWSYWTNELRISEDKIELLND